MFSTGAKSLETLPFRAIDYVVRSALTPKPFFNYQKFDDENPSPSGPETQPLDRIRLGFRVEGLAQSSHDQGVGLKGLRDGVEG